MNKEQIEKEAISYVMKETGYQVLPEHDKWKEAFIAGATAQHPKAWNEAIEAVMQLVFDEDGDFKQNESPATVREEIEALKLPE